MPGKLNGSPWPIHVEVNLSLSSVYILLSTFQAVAAALELASAVVAAAALVTSVGAQAGSRRHGQTILAEHDPNSRYVCKGPLSEFAACQCNEEASEVACVNAQFVDAGVFQHVSNYYKSMNKVTFHGNNFQDLPESPLFGDAPYESVHVLNISANYIVNLHSKALIGLPNVRVLDLNNNEIVLTEANVDFLTHTPRITHLYLRRAFTSVVNRTAQFELMLRMFSNAKLDQLRHLDLSLNYLTTVPYNLACPFPSITKIDLRQNLLKTLALNTTCLAKVETIDLSRNHFHDLDEPFRQDLANHLPPHSLLLRNSYYCDCHSGPYVQWIRSTNVIHEKNLLTCSKASPADFVGARLVEVPLHKLDCNTPLDATSSSTRTSDSFTLLLLLTTGALPTMLRRLYFALD